MYSIVPSNETKHNNNNKQQQVLPYLFLSLKHNGILTDWDNKSYECTSREYHYITCNLSEYGLDNMYILIPLVVQLRSLSIVCNIRSN